jgi:hypothetical protein
MKSTSILLFLSSLVGLPCCSSTSPATNDATNDAANDATNDATTDAGCTCETSAGLSTTDLACACAQGCADYAEWVTNLCGHAYFENVTETTYAGCTLKKLKYILGASNQVKVYEGTTGALAGFRSDDDVPGHCPGSGTPISSSLAAGTYEPPASCGQPTTRPLCRGADAGDGGADAAVDARAE